jgi:hypothetical protein
MQTVADIVIPVAVYHQVIDSAGSYRKREGTDAACARDTANRRDEGRRGTHPQ